MLEKRGRPLLYTNDAAVARRRQLATARQRDYRDRQRLKATPAAARVIIPRQLQQGERIMDFAFTDVDTAETLTQLGLRVQGVTLAQDPANTRLQHGALAVNAHDALY